MALHNTATPEYSRYSEIIDVRSPGEFAEDRVPGAINLPVLDNEERSRVGTIYKQESPFAARKMGAALISRHIADYLDDYFWDKDKDYHPLLYCWRGGTRSHSLALILAQIGWQVTVITGGYKTYRTQVRQQLTQLPGQFQYRLVRGLTGVGKTAILQHLARQGEQVIDLEAIANHRGSLLGQPEDNTPQPPQKWFESLLLQKFQSFQQSKTIWLEAESSTIGKLHIPAQLWHEMKTAPSVQLHLPLEMRVTHLLQQYQDLIEHPDRLKQQLYRLKYRYGQAQVQQWYDLIDREQWRELVSDLLTHHYDRAYHRSLQHQTPPDYEFALTNLSEAALRTAARSLRDWATAGC